MNDKVNEEKEDCFIPEENNPYPLCIGRGLKECEECQVYVGYDLDINKYVRC